MVLWFYVQEHPKAQPAVVLVFKGSWKMGQLLKVSLDRLGEARNRTCDPWFTRHMFIPIDHEGLVVFNDEQAQFIYIYM